jgi:proteasome lid subunit RPN8/RPN11
MGMTLEISIADRDAILAHAARSADEVCGLLLGEGRRVLCVEACANVAADPSRRFEIDPARLLAAHRAARSGGPRLIGHYHSHPSGDATPSPRDAADAAPDGSVWLLVAGGVLTGWRAVARGALHGRFDPVPLALPGCAATPEPPLGG